MQTGFIEIVSSLLLGESLEMLKRVPEIPLADMEELTEFAC